MKNKKRDKKKELKFKLTRKTGIWMMIIGLAFQFLNIITYGLFKIDIDIFGAAIFIAGLAIMIIWWKK